MAGDVGSPAFCTPIITGIKRGVIHLVMIGRIPTLWDIGRYPAGVAGVRRGLTLRLAALNRARRAMMAEWISGR